MEIVIENEFHKHRKKLEALGFQVNANRAKINVKTTAKVPFYIRKIHELGGINRIYLEDI